MAAAVVNRSKARRRPGSSGVSMAPIQRNLGYYTQPPL
jgi:hypothetical protein